MAMLDINLYHNPDYHCYPIAIIKFDCSRFISQTLP